jgi:hypothetical protein
MTAEQSSARLRAFIVDSPSVYHGTLFLAKKSTRRWSKIERCQPSALCRLADHPAIDFEQVGGTVAVAA